MSMSDDEYRDLTREWLHNSLEPSTKKKNEILKEGALAQVGGDQPVFHDAAMDQALNDYIEKTVGYIEEDFGESRETTMLLEVMKQYLVDALDVAILEAKSASGVRD